MTLLDKYRVESVLGKGGMGIVVCAFHPGLKERVAIKILRDDLADPDAAARFLREARATAHLKSDHVARVSDVGTTEAGMSYMVMELLDGVDIGQLLDAEPFEPSLAVTLILQACEALAEAHAAGIIHRDIKPTNLFVITRDERPHVKVLDFGISKVGAGMDGMSLTQTQSMLGTPAYMSPEQMRSARTVDARSDVWSLGTVLYEMIEGELPFTAENFSEMVVKVSVDPPTPPQRMPPAIAEVVLRCLQKSAEARYASMLELAQALAPLASDAMAAQDALDRIARHAGASTGPVRPVSAPAGSPIWGATAAAAAAASPSLQHVASLPPDTIYTPPPRSPWLLRGIVAAVVLGVGAVALGLTGGSSTPRDPPPSPLPPTVAEPATAPPLPDAAAAAAAAAAPPLPDAAAAAAAAAALPPPDAATAPPPPDAAAAAAITPPPPPIPQQKLKPVPKPKPTPPPPQIVKHPPARDPYSVQHPKPIAHPDCTPYDHPNGCK